MGVHGACAGPMPCGRNYLFGAGAPRCPSAAAGAPAARTARRGSAAQRSETRESGLGCFYADAVSGGLWQHDRVCAAAGARTGRYPVLRGTGNSDFARKSMVCSIGCLCSGSDAVYPAHWSAAGPGGKSVPDQALLAAGNAVCGLAFRWNAAAAPQYAAARTEGPAG